MAIRSISYLLLIAGFAMAQAPAPPDADAPPDEPGRQVARLSILNGDAQIKRGDTGEWMAAAVNTPLMAGDSLAVSSNGRAEIQFDQSNFVRIAADTEVRLWAMEDRRVEIQVAHGMVTWRVLRPGGPVSEISTPMAAIRPIGEMAVRVEVALDGSTRATPHHGEAEVSSPRGQEQVREGNTLVVEGQADTPTSRIVAAPPSDGWDQFNDQRDGFLTRAQSPRYASPDVYGTEDLDPYGRWVNDPNYGQVWSPNVPASWAPYRAGRWVWTDYYGWTWVDDAPWGWAPFHYGSWYFRVGYGWCWFPGPRQQHYFYHPAMVAFFGIGGGVGVGVGFGSVGWVPLAPFEPYRPWYGRAYGGRPYVVNNVTVVNNTNIYSSFRNARAFNGVTAVSVNDFRAGNYRHPVAVSQGQLTSASLVRGTPLTPTQSNLRFSDRAVSPVRVNPGAANQRFYSRMGAPQGEPGFRGGAIQAPARTAAPAQNDAWQRFGSPAAVKPVAPARVQEQPRAAEPGFGRQRFSAQPRTAAPPAPLQVAPPVVRQRQTPPPQNSGGGFGAPMRQPQARPAPSNPGVQRGGGIQGGGERRPAGPAPRNGGAQKGNGRERGESKH